MVAMGAPGGTAHHAPAHDPLHDDTYEETKAAIDDAYADSTPCGRSQVTIDSTGPVAERVDSIVLDPEQDPGPGPEPGPGDDDEWRLYILRYGSMSSHTTDVTAPYRLTYDGSLPGPTQLRLNLGTGRIVTHERLDAPEAISSHNDAGPVHLWAVDSLNAGLHLVSYTASTECPGGGPAEEIDVQYYQWDSRQRCYNEQSGGISETRPARGGPAPSSHTPTHADHVHAILLGTHTAPSLDVGDELYGGTIVHRDDVLRFYTVEVPPPRLQDFLARASADADIAYCESAIGVQLHGHTDPTDPNDPHRGTQYGLTRIKAEEAWHDLGSYGTTGKNLCILDTGVWSTHEDLSGSYLGGIDYTTTPPNPLPWDGHGHGTHVAGIAAASTNNALGIAGVSEAGFYMVKVFTDSGAGDWGWVASGIRWCADNGGDIISMSLGDTGRGTTAPPVAVANAVNYAWSNGKLLIAAAGNDGCPGCVTYPAKYANVMAITCTDAGDGICSFSNQGPESSVAAPGNAIRSTCRGGNSNYCDMSGTSMSTPQVSGAAALVWNAVPGLSNADVRQYLECGATDLGSAGFDNAYGNGRLDVQLSLFRAQAGSCSAVPCSGQILIDGAPDTGGVYTQADVSVTHNPGTAHPTAWRFTASDGVYLYVSNIGHDAKHVAAGDGNTRIIHVEVDLPCGVTLIEDFRMRN